MAHPRRRQNARHFAHLDGCWGAGFYRGQSLYFQGYSGECSGCFPNVSLLLLKIQIIQTPLEQKKSKINSKREEQLVGIAARTEFIGHKIANEGNTAWY